LALSQELKAAFSAQGYEQTSPTLFHIISDLSNSAVSTLDFASFVEIMTASSGVKVTKKTVKKVFSLFDDERAGFVSTKNIKRLAKELNVEISEHELQTMIEKADLDRDGLVSEEEFYSIMSR
jgi:Ca2+-binding EF-hand superfamily protein